MDELIAAQTEELERLRSLQQHRSTEFATEAVEDYFVGRKKREQGNFETTQRVPDLASSNQAATGVERSKKDDALKYKRRIKSSNNLVTESSFTASVLSKSIVPPVPNPSLKERESFYAAQINDMSWMGEIQRSVNESYYEGAQEGKVEEMQRELFNTVEALEGERIESKRVKGELVQKTLEVEELKEQNELLQRKLDSLSNGVPAAAELRALKDQVFRLAEEGVKREKIEEEMREMWKRSESNASEMEKKWVKEQEVMEAEFKRMAEWKSQAERGLAELEAEKKRLHAKCDKLVAERDQLEGRVRAAEERTEAVNVLEDEQRKQPEQLEHQTQFDRLVQIQRQKPIVTSPRRKTSSRSFDVAIDEEDEVVSLACIEVVGDGQDVKNKDGDAYGVEVDDEEAEEADEENDEEFMEVLADIVQDDSVDDESNVPPQAPPKTEAAKLLLLDVKDADVNVDDAAPPDMDGVSDTSNDDSDSVKSIEWVASSLTPRKLQHPPSLSDNFKKMQDIQRRPKARIEPSGVTRKVIPKSPTKRGKKKKCSPSVPIAKPPDSPPVPPRPRKQKVGGRAATSPQVSSPPAPPSFTGNNSEVPVEAPVPFVVKGEPELPSHLIVTEELQKKYMREQTPERKKGKVKKKKKKLVGKGDSGAKSSRLGSKK